MLTHLLTVFSRWLSQQVLAVVFLSSVDSLLCPASIFSLPPSVDRVLPQTAILSRLLFSAFLCQLTLSFFSGTLLPSSTSGLAGDPVLSPLCGFRVKKTKRFSDQRTHTLTQQMAGSVSHYVLPRRTGFPF